MSEGAQTATTATPSEDEFTRSPRADRQFWIALLMCASVLIVRSLLIALAHSNYYDDEYHLSRGLRFLTGNLDQIVMNDPPLGEAIVAFPLLVAGCNADAPSVLYDQHISPEAIMMLVAVWKALLFLPCAAVIFQWCRQLYGLKSAWLALGLIVVAEPNFAANIPIAALDVLAVEAILIACYLAWRYAQQPTRARLVALAAATAAAMLVKNTAVILPVVLLLEATLWMLISPARQPLTFRRRFNSLAAGALLTAFFLWAFTGFDLSMPKNHGRQLPTVYDESYSFIGDVVNPTLARPFPAGVYIGSLCEMVLHSRDGLTGFLFGEFNTHGWWYYYPVVATYKVPIGVAIIMLMGVASFWWLRPRREEWWLAVPMFAWSALSLGSTINLGFRHFLPAYVFMLMIASRCATMRTRSAQVVIWLAFIAAALHTASYHPDYLSYINFPRGKPHLAISDSNIDWGQSLRQIDRWMSEHPNAVAGRDVSLAYFGYDAKRAVRHYLGERVRIIGDDDPPPSSGLLFLSAVCESGVSQGDKFARMRNLRPRDTIGGNSMLVYDLDAIDAGSK